MLVGHPGLEPGTSVLIVFMFATSFNYLVALYVAANTAGPLPQLFDRSASAPLKYHTTGSAAYTHA